MNALLALLGLGAALVALGGSKKATVQAWVALPEGEASPAPPMQGNGFRMGPQPDPAAPNDDNRGRTFLVMEQSRQSGSEAEGTVPLMQLPMTANGKVSVVMWATRAGHPDRCTRWMGIANVKDGRLSSPPALSMDTCGTGGHATNTDAGGCTLNAPFAAWEQQGPTITLLWRTSVREGGVWSDNDCDENLQFYVDAFWRFTPS